MSGWMLAVDFGTSNTAAAHTGVVTGAATTLPLTHTGNLMSSAVFVQDPENIEVGEVALNRAETNPGAFIPSPKRIVGQGMAHANGYDIPAWLPVAAVLRVVIGKATAMHRDQPPAGLVLTHPEDWSPREVGTLLEAAAHLGFDRSRVSTVSEPRAAAHYYSRTETMAPGAKIAVFDFGGGTLDIAVLTATERNTFDVTAARGDNGLGGKNLDAVLRRWVDSQLSERNPGLLDFIRRGAPQHVLRNLEDSIRRAKELLSATPSATITVAGNGVQETLSITRPEFEAMISNEVGRAMALTRATLADAGIRSPHDLSALYLTGGSSRIPLVHQRLAELGPIATLDDPKTVVAQGALIALAPRQGIDHAPATAPAPVAQPDWPTTVNTFPPAQSGETVPAAAAPGSQSSARMWALVGGGVVLIAAIVAGVVFSLGGGDSPASTDTAGGSTTAATTATTAAGPLEDPDAIMATFPQQLRDSVGKCVKGSFTSEGALQLNCTLKPDSALAAYLPKDTYGSTSDTFYATADVREAKKTLAGWRDQRTRPDHTLVENSTKTAAAMIDTSESPYQDYANTESGLSFKMSWGTVGGDIEGFYQKAGML